MATLKSAKSKALFLGAAVLLLTSQSKFSTCAQSLGDQQQQSQEQSIESHGPSVVHVDVSGLNNLVSSLIETDKRTLITIPIVNGVAEPVHKSDLDKSADETSGHVFFEMDHQVPSPDILRITYPNEGRTTVDDSVESSAPNLGIQKIQERELKPEEKPTDEASILSPPNTDIREEKVNSNDDNIDSPKKNTKAPYFPGMDTIKSLWNSLIGADIVSTPSPGVLNVYLHEDVAAEESPGDSSTINPTGQTLEDGTAGINAAELEKGSTKGAINGEKEISDETTDIQKNTKVVQSETGQFVVVNKLNKNYDDPSAENEEDINPTLLQLNAHQNSPDSITGNRDNHIIGHHHHHIHHHHTSSEKSPLQLQQEREKEEQWQLWQKQRQSFTPKNNPVEESLEDVVIVDENPYIFAAIAHQHQSPFQMDQPKKNDDQALAVSSNGDIGNLIARAASENGGERESENETAGNKWIPEDENLDDEKNDSQEGSGAKEDTAKQPQVPVEVNPEIPDSISNRGLIPSVKGAHHCTPQFCVNVSLSDDGQFATFHIERPLAETGWISLGIGYAMTMADLLIFWPNPTAENGGGPRGAVLSRRTSHAYVEPQLVGQKGHGPLGDNIKEASLYPPNEYILHNSNPEAVVSAASVFPDNSKFVVQFTRPVRIKNKEFKLNPGEEQDFCWAYSPKPVSPDSVADPAAHITQHLSVGSFAMDVGANQPHLKEVLEKQKIENEKADALEKEMKAKSTMDKSNDGGVKSGSKSQHTTQSSAKPGSATNTKPISVFAGFISFIASIIFMC